MIQPGSIVRRCGEERRYRVINLRARQKIGTHEIEIVAVMQPAGESWVKRVIESVSLLVEVGIIEGIG